MSGRSPHRPHETLALLFLVQTLGYELPQQRLIALVPARSKNLDPLQGGLVEPDAHRASSGSGWRQILLGHRRQAVPEVVGNLMRSPEGGFLRLRGKGWNLLSAMDDRHRSLTLGSHHHFPR